MAGLGLLLGQPPASDNCASAILITFPSSNYGIGVFYSDTVDITGATLQPGEYIPQGSLMAKRCGIGSLFLRRGR
jgi:hypothetical protein